jgi:hypothetical protein
VHINTRLNDRIQSFALRPSVTPLVQLLLSFSK